VRRTKKPEKDNNLYDIEVTEVDKDKKCTKIHNVGYRNTFDECGDFKSTVISYRLSASKKFMIQTKNRLKAESKCFTTVYVDYVERLSEKCGLAGKKCPDRRSSE